MKNKINSIIIILVLNVFLVNVADAKILISDYEVKYDDEILNILAQNEWVEVIIDFNEMNNLDNIFSDFSDKEIKGMGEWPYSQRIDAEISRKGFNKLINESRIESIYYNFPVRGSKETGINLLPFFEKENKILNNFLILSLFLVAVFLIIFTIYFRMKKGGKHEISKR